MTYMDSGAWLAQEAEVERLQHAFQDAWAERNEARDRITAALALHYEDPDYRPRCITCPDDNYPCSTARALGVES